MVLGWPLLTSLPALIQLPENPVHGADRAQILLLLEQTLIDFCRGLITIGSTVQCLKHGGPLLRTQRPWLHRMFPRVPW